MLEKEFIEKSIESIELLEDLNEVQSVLKSAKEWGLEVEIVTWALKAMKRNSFLSISEAINEGYAEWVK